MSSAPFSRLLAVLLVAVSQVSVGNAGDTDKAQSAARTAERASLGARLFFDTNFSLNRSQSCSSCHDPAKAFTESRDSGLGGAVSPGDDGTSFGTRNAPSLTYVSLVSEFHVTVLGDAVGGLFIDGRAADLLEQAAEPFLNPVEMAMRDVGAVVDRLRENESYVAEFETLFGPAVFADDERAFLAMRESIATYLRSPQFSSFDSKYDRWLRGEEELSALEETGRVLFFSNLVNCIQCHLTDNGGSRQFETFTNSRYHNIGVPGNPALHAAEVIDDGFVDEGLLQNPRIDDQGARGKFRVPGLRNVAVTGPYMHNGVFAELETAILFYSQFTVVNADSVVNPETGRAWAVPEVAETIDFDILEDGQPIDAGRAKAIAAFLRTLTDQRYEHLLAQ